ncbi:CaiB/BaiF CoA transferase family protein [Comamonas endophytica]|uniref:CoA transferase n=1 Tax=Comamonas endophytica TaxID=2949090 RepID=A0ABY6G950_9BURK|nr:MULTISPECIES: CoA transferase [unclassified Acidovorax]MCD2511837.1 CoA transferase [Acidovorax sp. D4N7]UYG51560.1 CoA transferase [Acidovorax sp. 5MLIR]
MLPLQGLTVVDLSTVVFGPLASQILGDYGATVIKVEAPEGDSTRRTGPAREEGMAALFLGTNRNKKSVVLDLRLEQARAALQQLVARADVFMHSMRPQKLARLGIDPESLLERHPRLVYAGLHGFAQGGPYAGKPAYDDVIQGMSGIADLMQQQGGKARYLPMVAADKTCGNVAAHAILAALMRRERTGHGGFVEIPMYESMVGFNLVEHLYGQHFAPALAGAGYPRVMAPARRPYATSDGYVAMMPYTDAHWQRFFAETGRPELAEDARFCSMAQRTAHIDALLEIAAERISARSSAYWLQTCERLEIPVAPITRLADLQADPHLQATGFFQRLDDPAMGALNFPANPVRFDGQRLPLRVPPRLGEHTRGCLLEAGLAPELIDQLLAAGQRSPTPNLQD